MDWIRIFISDEDIFPKTILGISGPAGVGKTQFSLTIAAKMSHNYEIGIYSPETYSIVKRLKELEAEMKNIYYGIEKGDLIIIDDLTLYSKNMSIRELMEFLSSLKRPAIITTQIRLHDIPAIKRPRIRRYYVDERLELDGRYGYIRMLTRKKRAFRYHIEKKGFVIDEILDL